jgi:hypothetical protein
MKHILLAVFAAITLTSPAFAQAADCPDLTALQRVAGYVTLLGLLKIIGACVIAGGLLLLTGGILVKVIYRARVLLEILAYVVSLALIASGYWLTDSSYLTWTVFTGCILFGGSVMASLWIHKIDGDDPKPLAAFFMVVWGAVAVFYNMPEVGFLSAMALMTILGFSIIVKPMCYAFGFEEDKHIPTATMAGIFLLIVFCVVHIFVPEAISAVTVFKPGVFWVASFVAFIGLLIMSSKWYAEGRDYITLQLITVVVLGAALAAGLTFGINPLAGMAGTFLVFYLAAKPIEIPADSKIAWGINITISGFFIFGGWWLGTKNIELVSQYLTTSL